jgi:hypothetical protein
LQITVITTKALRQRAMGFSLLALLLTGCGRAPAETLPEVSSHRECLLNLISPLESTQVSGGQDLRITLYLVDQNGLPVEGATVQAELWTPSGKRFASLPCTDRGEGRYLSEYASLSLRGASGTWHVIGKATWDDGQQAEVEGTLQVKPSISEMYQDRYGFWIEHPRIFGLGTGFYNLSESGGLHFEDWLNDRLRTEPGGERSASPRPRHSPHGSGSKNGYLSRSTGLAGSRSGE